ncbi:beta-lactamase [Bacillus cereus]|nr:beta-lactamase [Bacillus cereus]
MNLKSNNIYEKMNQHSVAGLSLAVIRDRKLDEAFAFGTLESGTTRTVTTNSIFNSCSISKFITTMLVMTLSDQEIVHLDEDVNDHILEYSYQSLYFTEKNYFTKLIKSPIWNY